MYRDSGRLAFDIGGREGDTDSRGRAREQGAWERGTTERKVETCGVARRAVREAAREITGDP